MAYWRTCSLNPMKTNEWKSASSKAADEVVHKNVDVKYLRSEWVFFRHVAAWMNKEYTSNHILCNLLVHCAFWSCHGVKIWCGQTRQHSNKSQHQETGKTDAKLEATMKYRILRFLAVTKRCRHKCTCGKPLDEHRIGVKCTSGTWIQLLLKHSCIASNCFGMSSKWHMKFFFTKAAFFFFFEKEHGVKAIVQATGG